VAVEETDDEDFEDEVDDVDVEVEVEEFAAVGTTNSYRLNLFPPPLEFGQSCWSKLQYFIELTKFP